MTAPSFECFSYNDMEWIKDTVPVRISDLLIAYENKDVYLARQKGIHEYLDALYIDFEFCMCKPFRESGYIYIPEFFMYKWYHNVVVLTYYLIRNKVKEILTLVLINVILSDYRFYIYSNNKKYDISLLADSDFCNCIESVNKDILTNNEYLNNALATGKRECCNQMYKRNQAMLKLLEKCIDKNKVSTKELIDFILTYNSDDYIPSISLDFFGKTWFSFVGYIKHNKDSLTLTL